jgi:hypothetical protein
MEWNGVSWARAGWAGWTGLPIQNRQRVYGAGQLGQQILPSKIFKLYISPSFDPISTKTLYRTTFLEELNRAIESEWAERAWLSRYKKWVYKGTLSDLPLFHSTSLTTS